MSFFSKLLGAAAPVIGGVFGGPAGSAIGGALGGLLGGGSKQSGQTTSTNQQQIDPRLAALLYGQDGSQGLLGQAAAMAGTPRSSGQLGFQQGIDNYLGNYGADSFVRSQQAAQALQGSNYQAPRVDAAQVGSAQVQAPSQNNLDLSKGYNDFIYGQPGANPYLTGAIQKGINQGADAFRSLQQDSTQNLTQSVLPSIRGGAIASGGYGGSRQGLAEGMALSNFGKEQSRALSQFGQNATDSAIAAQSGAYDADRSRSLAALQGLSGQQYGVASQNAAQQQQTNNLNAQLWADAQRLNQQSALSTNQLNSSNQAAGVGLSSNLLGQANAYNIQNQNYGLDRLGQASGILGQFSGQGGSSSQSTPYYSNSAGNLIGGAAAGLGLYNQFSQGGGGGRSGGGGYNTFSVSPGTAPVNNSSLQNLSWWG